VHERFCPLVNESGETLLSMRGSCDAAGVQPDEQVMRHSYRFPHDDVTRYNPIRTARNSAADIVPHRWRCRACWTRSCRQAPTAHLLLACLLSVAMGESQREHRCLPPATALSSVVVDRSLAARDLTTTSHSARFCSAVLTFHCLHLLS
jgi:hypothetical protein